MTILAIDQGTTSTRGFLVNKIGQGKIIQSITHKQNHPKAGWVEHDPEELLRNISLCIDQHEDIQAIGIANQGESCLAWDSQTKEAASPVIVWQDNRTAESIKRLKAEGLEDYILEKSGLPLDPYFSASKLAWICKNIPKVASLKNKGRLRIGTTDAFFLDSLTGIFATDVTTASRTSLMNIGACQWDQELCDIFNVPIDCLPEIVPTTGRFGEVKSKNRSVPILASVVDQQAALYGHGCQNKGDAKITFGTGAFALTVTGDDLTTTKGTGLLPTIAWQLDQSPVTYALEGGVFSAGSAVNWAKGIGLFKSYDQINEFDQNIFAAQKDLFFVPALTGLGCPHWDTHSAGTWLGLSLSTNPQEMMLSVLEGIAFRTAEVISAMQDLAPLGKSISIDGGLSSNPYFCQLLADTLQHNITVLNSTELTALGTALFVNAQQKYVQHFPATTAKNYQPKKKMNNFLPKFKEAVSRSANWLT